MTFRQFLALCGMVCLIFVLGLWFNFFEINKDKVNFVKIITTDKKDSNK